MRFLASVCILAVLLALVVPAAATPVFLVQPSIILDAPSGSVLRRAVHAVVPPDLALCRRLPARAPPLA